MGYGLRTDWLNANLRRFSLILLVQCNYSDAETNLDMFKAKYTDVDLGGGVNNDVTGGLLRCICRVFLSPGDYTFSPTVAVRSRARAPTNERSRAPNLKRRLAGESNPWARVHAHDKGDGDISNPVVLLALCVGVDESSPILSAYLKRALTDITGRGAASSRSAFERL